MADLLPVTDLTDPRLAEYAGLTDAALRRRIEPERGLFMAEGATVIRRAVGAGYAVRSLLLSPAGAESLADVLETLTVPAFVAPEPVLAAVTGFGVHRGALAAMQRRPLPDVADLAAGARRLLVLEDLVDPTNVGAAVRSAAALGVDAVLLSPRCADPLYRRAVKVSMGATLVVPHARMTRWDEGPAELRAAGLRVVALTPAPDAVDVSSADPGERWALVAGTEGPGLSSRWLRESDVRVRIPMQAGIDSLNVAAAVAVACWAFGRR